MLTAIENGGVIGAFERRRGERAANVIRGDRALDDLKIRRRSLGECRRRFVFVIAAREFAEAGFDFSFDLVRRDVADHDHQHPRSLKQSRVVRLDVGGGQTS